MFYNLIFLQYDISNRSISLTLVTHGALSAHWNSLRHYPQPIGIFRDVHKFVA